LAHIITTLPIFGFMNLVLFVVDDFKIIGVMTAA
jgi:hypothetical protein